jgi:hypothetical protein
MIHQFSQKHHNLFTDSNYYNSIFTSKYFFQQNPNLINTLWWWLKFEKEINVKENITRWTPTSNFICISINAPFIWLSNIIKFFDREWSSFTLAFQTINGYIPTPIFRQQSINLNPGIEIISYGRMFAFPLRQNKVDSFLEW